MQATLTIIRYRKRFIPLALLSMAVFHIPFWIRRDIIFYKLMGSGKSGSFDKVPDLQQWAIFTVQQQVNREQLHPGFISKWLRFFSCEVCSFILEPLDSKGKWDGVALFENTPKTGHTGAVAVLTRATIRLSRLKNFWKNVPAVSENVKKADGFILSFGVGEIPWVKQATFSIWKNMDLMKAFAYSTRQHAEVIRKTHKEQWYTEEMFTRFKIIACTGTLYGKNPLEANNVHL